MLCSQVIMHNNNLLLCKSNLLNIFLHQLKVIDAHNIPTLIHNTNWISTCIFLSFDFLRRSTLASPLLDLMSVKTLGRSYNYLDCDEWNHLSTFILIFLHASCNKVGHPLLLRYLSQTSKSLFSPCSCFTFGSLSYKVIEVILGRYPK